MKIYTHVLLIILIIILGISPTVSPARAALYQTTFQDLVYGGDSYDYPWTMEPLPGGGFIVAATTQSFGQPHLQRYDGSLWVTRITPEGRLALSMLYTPPKPAVFYDSALLPDGSIVVVGSTGDYREAVVARIAANGTPVYYEYLSPGVPVYSIGLTSVDLHGNNIVAVGFFYDLSRYKAIQWIVVLDRNGTVLSSVGIDLGAPYYYPITFSLHIEGDTAVIAGYGYTNPGFVLGYNLTGNTIEYAYKVGDSRGDKYYGVTVEGGQIILVGVTDDLGGEDAAIISIQDNGTLNWGLLLRSNGTDRLFGVYTDGEHVYVSGWAQPEPDRYGNDTLVAKVRLADGRLAWHRIIGSVNDDWAYRTYVDQAGNVYAIGGYGTPIAWDDVIILRLSSDGGMISCPLIRNTTLTTAPYTPPITPITPTILAYTTTPTLQPLSYTNITVETYRLCPPLVGGTAHTTQEPGTTSIYTLAAGILIILYTATLRRAKPQTE